nr:hypothetical protein CFP56_16710 [Quercus suber]
MCLLVREDYGSLESETWLSISVEKMWLAQLEEFEVVRDVQGMKRWSRAFPDQHIAAASAGGGSFSGGETIARDNSARPA